MKYSLLFACLFAAVTAAAQGSVRDSLDFDRMKADSPAEMLRGKVSGVNVTASQGGVNGLLNTSVRGFHSVRSLGEPLWIVDGVMLNPSPVLNQDAFWQTAYSGKSYTSSRNRLAFINPYDIESIEVIKNASAAAMYGSMGNDGVIIVRTRTAEEGDGARINWHTDVGLNLDASPLGLSPGLLHHHTLSVSSRTGRNSYRISASLKSVEGTVNGDKALEGGLNINIDVRASSKIWFGLRSTVGIGDSNMQEATSWPGSVSTVRLLRDGLDGDAYGKDYDDKVRSYRAINDLYLQVNITPALHWITDFGVDYMNEARYFWYGNATEFGLGTNGAASICTANMLSTKGTTSVEYELYLKEAHHLSVLAGIGSDGVMNKFNTMNGSNFFNHELRAKGLNYNDAKAMVRKFNQSFPRTGIFAKAGYDYRKIAGISASVRYDSTSPFDYGKFTPYPAAEAYIHASEGLTVKGGWGKTGKENYVPCEWFGAFCPSLVIPGLVPETESLYDALARTTGREAHAGFEAALAGGRLNLAMTAYSRHNDDRFTYYCTGRDSGKVGRWVKDKRKTLGYTESEVVNRGIELDLTATALKKENLIWTVEGHAALQHNDIVSIAREDEDWSFPASVTFPTEEAFPKVFGSLSSRVSFHAFTADIRFDGAAGHKILNMDRAYEEGAMAATSDYLEKGDFLRLGSLSFSYRIKPRKGPVKGIDINLTGHNLACLSSFTGYDPDVDSFSSSAFRRGAAWSAFPPMRTVILGTSLTF